MIKTYLLKYQNLKFLSFIIITRVMMLKKRSASVSSAGKVYDRYFSGPYLDLNNNKKHSSLPKSSSQNSIALPKLKGANTKIEEAGER